MWKACFGSISAAIFDRDVSGWNLLAPAALEQVKAIPDPSLDSSLDGTTMPTLPFSKSMGTIYTETLPFIAT